MKNKFRDVSVVLVGLLSLTAVTYAFDFDSHFDKSVLLPKINNLKFEPVEKKVEVDVPVEVKKVPVTPVISTNGFSYVTTVSNGKVSSIDKYYDDVAGVVCYVSATAMQCLKAY